MVLNMARFDTFLFSWDVRKLRSLLHYVSTLKLVTLKVPRRKQKRLYHKLGALAYPSSGIPVVYIGQCAFKWHDINENLGMHFREGKHRMTLEHWDALLDFADQKLLGKPGVQIFNEIPPAAKTP